MLLPNCPMYCNAWLFIIKLIISIITFLCYSCDRSNCADMTTQKSSFTKYNTNYYAAHVDNVDNTSITSAVKFLECSYNHVCVSSQIMRGQFTKKVSQCYMC